jgi:hypothetical protein
MNRHVGMQFMHYAWIPPGIDNCGGILCTWSNKENSIPLPEIEN